MSDFEKWSSGTFDKYVLCSVPGCGHIGKIITKAHCRLAHGLEREEVAKQYGYPTKIYEKRGERA